MDLAPQGIVIAEIRHKQALHEELLLSASATSERQSARDVFRLQGVPITWLHNVQITVRCVAESALGVPEIRLIAVAVRNQQNVTIAEVPRVSACLLRRVIET